MRSVPCHQADRGFTFRNQEENAKKERKKRNEMKSNRLRLKRYRRKKMLKAHSRCIPKSPKTAKLVQLHLKLQSNRWQNEMSACFEYRAFVGRFATVMK